MTKRERKKVTVFSAESGNNGWLPENFQQAIAWLQEKFDSIPAEYRETATIEIDSGTYYDSTYSSLEIEYFRPETDEEMNSRVANQQSRAEEERRREIDLLERLKAKYGEK